MTDKENNEGSSIWQTRNPSCIHRLIRRCRPLSHTQNPITPERIKRRPGTLFLAGDQRARRL